MSIKICPYPFSRSSFGERVHIPCCSSWLTNEYFSLDHSGLPGMSKAAVSLRESVLDGSFKYCRREICKYPLIDISELDTLDEHEVFIGNKELQQIREGKFDQNFPITSLTIEADSRCNLACPSCRKEPIFKVQPDWDNRMRLELIRFSQVFKSIKKVKFGGYGEFFFSPLYQELLQVLYKLNPSGLREVAIITNGTLITKANFEKLGPARKLITEINVSIDAGDESTFKNVRDGNWNQLLKNLHFLRELRFKKEIEKLRFNFVVQKNNLESVENFIELGNLYGVDHIDFTHLLDWQMMKLDFKENAVHIPGHQHFARYLELWEKFHSHPKVKWELAT